jgi:beta-phosphoglucomutase
VSPEAIIFDAEGVVIDTEAVWDEGQRIFLDRRRIDYDRGRIKPMLTGRSLEDGTRFLMEHFDLEGEVGELARERADIVRALMATVQFVPGFLEFFAQVRGPYETGVATAMAEELFEIVDSKLRIRELFERHVYTLVDVGQKSKPDPDLFLFAASKLGVSPEACIVIEDSPHGVEASRRAGMSVIGLATTYEPKLLADADLVVESFAELDPGCLTGRALDR